MRLFLLFALGCGGTEKPPGADPSANGAEDIDDDAIDSGSDGAGAPPPTISFAPHWQWIGPHTARFRVETREAVDLSLTLTEDGTERTEPLARTTAELTHYWPTPEPMDEVPHPDLPGPHHLHELVLDNLTPGSVVGWSLATDVEPIEGTLHVPPEPGGAFRAVFVGDTMAPWSDDVFAQAATHQPELMLHGGDLQYQSNPFDTWSGLSWGMAPLSATAAFHPAVGNHEHEGHDEFSQMYQRLFSELGTAEPPPGASYYRLDHGGVRFLALDSEGKDSHHLAAPDSLQLAWLQDELEDAAENPDVMGVVAYFHRPVYTLAKHEPDTATRAVLHPVLRDGGVQLVLQAHNHSYERMVVDGMHYVTDGGGGALLYDVDASVEAYPDEVPLRVAASQSFGFTRLDFADGTVELQRFDDAGTLIDSATIPLEPAR